MDICKATKNALELLEDERGISLDDVSAARLGDKVTSFILGRGVEEMGLTSNLARAEIYRCMSIISIDILFHTYLVFLYPSFLFE